MKQEKTTARSRKNLFISLIFLILYVFTIDYFGMRVGSLLYFGVMIVLIIFIVIKYKNQISDFKKQIEVYLFGKPLDKEQWKEGEQPHFKFLEEEKKNEK